MCPLLPVRLVRSAQSLACCQQDPCDQHKALLPKRQRLSSLPLEQSER